jgi:hypothetical protein
VKIDSIERLLREDMPDAPDGEWLDILLRVVNSANERTTNALRTLRLAENCLAGFGTFRLTDATATIVRVPEGVKGRPRWVVACQTIAAPGVARPSLSKPLDWEHVDNDDPKAPAQVKVTASFSAAVSADVVLFFSAG